MKPLNELINTDESAWELIQEWLASATNHYQILPKNQAQADKELYNTQVTTRSPMGAVIYETGGILIDNGWLRILGSGSDKLNRGINSWNQGKTFTNIGDTPTHFLIADDIIGGYFSINAGGIGADIGTVYYLAQDTLEWESLDCDYSDFLYWALTGDLAEFYEPFRWESWQTDILDVDGNQVFSFYPFLWTDAGKNINDIERKLIPIEENYRLTIQFCAQLNT